MIEHNYPVIHYTCRAAVAAALPLLLLLGHPTQRSFQKNDAI
jgi:hypothetical protein